MARENQSLQVALIILFMVTVILGIFVFFSMSAYIEHRDRADEAEAKLAAVNEANNKIQGEYNQLKTWILGTPDAEEKELADINDQFNTDMEKFAGGFDETLRFYHPALAELQRVLDEKSGLLIDANNDLQDLDDEYEQWKKQMTAQVEKHNQALLAAEKKLKDAEGMFDGNLAQIRAGKDKIQADWDKVREEGENRLALLAQQRDDAETEKKDLITQRDRTNEELMKLKKETFEVPDGEIIWVDQRAGMVWINLGRGDALRRQTTFSVYPIDTTNLARAGKKAGIEVTRIIGQRQAEARVVEEISISDPILVGDKIHTPAWSPGEQRRFALVGFMDLDQDGTNDLMMVKDLIQMSGGKVDCTIDEAGNRDGGEMGIDTRYLVLGEDVDYKDLPATAKAYHDVISAAVDEGKKYGMQQLKYGDLLKQMGWKNQTPVVRFGQGANPRDFDPRPGPGVPQVSVDATDDQFRPRRIPSRKTAPRGGAY